MSTALFSKLVPLLWRVPVLNERLAARLFVTPLGKPRPEELLPPSVTGQSFELHGTRTFSGVRYGQGAPVLLVHGWGGRGAQMNGFVDELCQRGYSAITLDLPAHGASRGSRTNAFESSEALLAIEREFGSPRAIIAHSYGAAASALAVRRGLSTEAFVFVAPLPTLEVAVEQFALRAALPQGVVERAARRVEKQLGIDRQATDLRTLGPELRTPVLFVHDQGDRIIAHAHSQNLADIWPRARLLTTEGLGHQRILRDRAVVSRAVGFVEQGTDRRHSDLSELRLTSRFA